MALWLFLLCVLFVSLYSGPFLRITMWYEWISICVGHTVKQIHNVIQLLSAEKYCSDAARLDLPALATKLSIYPWRRALPLRSLKYALENLSGKWFYKLVSCGSPSGRLAKCSEDWTFLRWGSVIRERFPHQKSTTRGENGYVGASGFTDLFWTSAAASFQAQSWTKPLRVINASYCVLLLHRMQLVGVKGHTVPVLGTISSYFLLASLLLPQLIIWHKNVTDLSACFHGIIMVA